MPSFRKTALALAALALFATAPVMAGVPKVVFLEEFSATW